jgi:hypothetical protein
MRNFILVLALFLTFGLFIYARLPNEYSDYYARNKIIPMTYFYDTSLFNTGQLNMTDFMNGCYNKSEWIGLFSQPCPLLKTDTTVTCTGGVAVIHDEEAIMITFRGTSSGEELNDEQLYYNFTTSFPGGGTVDYFYYNGFLTLWNNGMRDAFLSQKNKYPSYEVWVVGTSMGGSLAGMSAAYISQLGYVDPSVLKLMTFGQLRIGKADFIFRFPTLVPYSYRVTFHHDIVPHLIPLEAGYKHYGKEIWYYSSYWYLNAPYIECDNLESTNCSDSVPKANWTWGDHYYFNNHLCPPYNYTTF